MTEVGVQTPAPHSEPDMFDAVPPASPAAPSIHDDVLDIPGEMIRGAEVRTKVVGSDQHPVPVLCMDIRPLNHARRTIHAEQIFTEATRKVAEQKAAALKKGVRITITTSERDKRIIYPHVLAVALIPVETHS